MKKKKDVGNLYKQIFYYSLYMNTSELTETF